MFLIDCPYCGERDEAEFVCGGEAHIVRPPDPDAVSDEQLKAFIKQRMLDFRDNAPTSAAEAATIILTGVRSEKWRILVGEDAQALDQLVRDRLVEFPEPVVVLKSLEKASVAAFAGARIEQVHGVSLRYECLGHLVDVGLSAALETGLFVDEEDSHG